MPDTSTAQKGTRNDVQMVSHIVLLLRLASLGRCVDRIATDGRGRVVSRDGQVFGLWKNGVAP